MVYLKINDTLYPASFRQRVQDTDWLGRGSMAITVSMSYEQAVGIFVNGLRWQHVQQTEDEPIITDYSEYEMAGPITDNRDGTITVKMGKALSQECNTVLTGDNATMTVREMTELRSRMETVFEKAAPAMTTDEVISNRVMCKVWVTGKHTAGEVYSTGDQIWQCIQDYDNEVYPDIMPLNAAWNTFHKPYHGTTKETARPWVSPTGAHDMYLTGEFMIWIDGLVYECIQNTNFSPVDYQQAWKAYK